jgi:FlaA1/EpsC-like NDP-sugar epimerase
MLKNFIRNTVPFLIRYRSWLIAVFQAGIIFLSLVLAWLLRFDFTLPDQFLLFSVAPVLILIRLVAITCFGLLHGWWRYTGVKDAIEILKAVVTGSAAFWVILHYGLGITTFPRSIYFIEGLLTACLLGSVRLLSRLLAEHARRNLNGSKRVLLIGAGFAAQMIIRETMRPDSGYAVVACLDDDVSKLGIKLHGVPVVGQVEQLPELLSSHAADQVLIAVPTATGQQMQRFVEICQRARITFKTVPALRDILTGQVSINQVRDVSLDDLLGREPAGIDLDSVRKQIEGRAVMVTGAAGSIGSELCRQILTYHPASLVCVDQSETGVFFLRLDLIQHQNGACLSYCVADVANSDRMRRLFMEHEIQIVFHAAAYKHVPIMEMNVDEAVRNNVFALLSLLDTASDAGCGSFILISSDKAVNPTSIMGATKRICELILLSRPAGVMRCVSVRFGNVLGSSGSVVPVFKQQLRDNQPLTITHPEIRRFFMVTREAVALVLQAVAIGGNGDILVLDMGEPVSILSLARTLIRLSGKSEQSVQIQFTGLREGEKLEEELFYSHEDVHPTACERIKRVRNTQDGWTLLQRRLEELRANLALDSTAAIREKIKEIVPEYSCTARAGSENRSRQSLLAVPMAVGRRN